MLWRQDISDWVRMMGDTADLLQRDDFRLENSMKTAASLSPAQVKSQDLFLFSEQSEKKSWSSQIYSNIGLASLGIWRLLQV